MTTIDYFKQICRIPRESGNEEGIRKFLVSWAGKNGFESAVDETGNVIIYCPATPGMESVPPLALQGHMDMVCVKREDSNHDFLKDPIEPYEKDGFLWAKDTSLGADNGIAVAMVMALFTDPDAVHGPLEGIFTVSEETKMVGAFGLDPSLIKSRRLLNLDSEEEGVIYIGCAGGLDVKGSYKAESLEKVPAGMSAIDLKLSGMKGGHSGGEIHKQRANAIRIMARLLLSIREEGASFMLSQFTGGNRSNVIPHSAHSVICVKTSEKKNIMHNIIMPTFEQLQAEYAIEEPDMDLEHFCSDHHPDKVQLPQEALDEKTSSKLMSAIVCLPHGVDSFSKSVEGVVHTSDNLAIVRLNGAALSVDVSVRSLSQYGIHLLSSRIKMVLEQFGFETNSGNGYPAWTPNPHSPLCAFCAKAWKEMTGKEAKITSIHAGLECGVINSRVPGMDSISTGPDLFDVHSVNEHLSLASAERVYNFVKHLVGIIR